MKSALWEGAVSRMGVRVPVGPGGAAVLLLAVAPMVLAAQEAKPAAAAPRPAAAAAPESWAVATADTMMRRYPDYRTAYFRPWTYVHGYVLYGFEMLYRSTGDKKYFDYMKRYVDQIVDEKGNLRYTDRKTSKVVPVSLTNLDNMMTGNIVVAMYEYTRDERYRIAAGRIRKAFDTYPRNSDGGFWHAKSLKGQMWIDGVFMGQMFLTRYGKSVGDSAYCFDEAAKQITVFARRGRKGDTGLYYHGWSESPGTTRWADPKTGLSPEVWSEGLGWYALILVETLAVLPRDHPRRAEVEDILRRLAAGLKRTQDPKTGRWFQVVDKGDRPDNWTDTSGSAMFVYCLQRAIDLGLIGKEEYAPVVAKGYRGVIANAKVNGEGLVDVYSACDGLGVQKDYDRYIKYKQRVNAKEAVGGFLWATAIVEKPGLKKPKVK
jgi:rhamnogalacturonyl hydrolase YesR